MNKKDILEIKRRFKKEDATFSRLVGCYVDCNRNKICKFGGSFLNLEEEEFYKYLEIANKSLSGTLGNNLLELSFPLQEEEVGGRQQILMALRESKLEDEGLLDAYYDLIIDTYDYTGNYLILLFHDTYDVLTKTSDQDALDESEEVYRYLICAICPVTLSKPGLGYLEEEGRIGARVRDWVVGAPDTAFVFPAFTDRSTDIHSTLFYTKNTKEPHAEFMANGLGCPIKLTATEEKATFHTIVRNTLGAESEETEDFILDIQQSLNDMMDEYEETHDEDAEGLILDKPTVSKLLADSNVPAEKIARIESSVEEAFGDTPPAAEHILDSKALDQGQIRKDQKELAQYKAHLHSYDVVLHVKPVKASQIHSTIIDGQKCLVIPMDEDEQASINGVNAAL